MTTTTSELGLTQYSDDEIRTGNPDYDDTVQAVDDLAAGAQRRRYVTATDSPGNGAETAVAAGTEIHVVNPDGTNAVNLDAAAEEGREVTVVHNGGANTPTLSFAGADFVGSAPSNITTAGESVTVVNVDGTTSGWVIA